MIFSVIFKTGLPEGVTMEEIETVVARHTREIAELRRLIAGSKATQAHNVAIITGGFEEIRQRFDTVEAAILDLQEGYATLSNRVEEGFAFVSKQIGGLRKDLDELRGEVIGLKAGQDQLRQEMQQGFEELKNLIQEQRS